MQPIRTTSGKQLVEALDYLLDEQQRIDLDEASTFTRTAVRSRIEAYKAAIGVVRSLLPYAETDAVQRAMPGVGLTEAEFLLGDPAVDDRVDDPTDPTLPFVVVMA